MTDITTESQPLAGRLALITGASRGLGYAVAKAFAAAGAELILVARTVGGLEELDDELQRRYGRVSTLVPLDVKDGAGIDRLGGAVFERWGRLDILVGNAGVLGDITPLGHLKPKVWDEVLAVNLTANWRLIRSFDPLLRAGPAGRAIFTTSGAARKTRPYWGGYSVTKAALEALVKTYAAETARTPVRINMVSPGPMRTAMRARAMPGEDPDTLPAPDAVAPLFVDLARADCTRHGDVVDYVRP